MRLLIVGVGAADVHAQRVDVLAERTEQRRQQGDRGQHRHPTAIAAVYPSVDTSGMPATKSEHRAITTVTPAKTTAPPEVAVARAIDSSIGTPWPRCSLCLVTMKRA